MHCRGRSNTPAQLGEGRILLFSMEFLKTMGNFISMSKNALIWVCTSFYRRENFFGAWEYFYNLGNHFSGVWEFFYNLGNFHPHTINHYISTNYAHASWVWVKTTGPSVYTHYLPPEYTSCTAFRIYGQYSVYTKNVCLQYKYTVSTEKTPCKPFKGCMSFDTHLR